ncbi:MAG: transcriptional regulator [Myxococcota bacterium]|jgi:hypothetical protein
MGDSAWDLKVKAFLKKTGEDFKRFGKDVRAEAQRLMTEVKDPERQAKLREGLREVGHWARKAAEDVATVMETGVKKAEDAFRQASGKVTDFVAKDVEGAGAPTAKAAPPPAPTPPSPPPDMSDAPKSRAKKTVGPKASKPGAAKKAPGAKKTIGKKKGAATGE